MHVHARRLFAGAVVAAVCSVLSLVSRGEVRSVPAGGTCVFDFSDEVFNKKGNVLDLGAITSDEFVPGPIYLQGDHSDADFRNLVLTPIVK